MFEVFNYLTGETIGFVPTEWGAWAIVKHNPEFDFICADHNSTECACFGANRTKSTGA